MRGRGLFTEQERAELDNQRAGFFVETNAWKRD
jgi:hypothetical protein